MHGGGVPRTDANGSVTPAVSASAPARLGLSALPCRGIFRRFRLPESTDVLETAQPPSSARRRCSDGGPVPPVRLGGARRRRARHPHLPRPVRLLRLRRRRSVLRHL